MALDATTISAHLKTLDLAQQDSVTARDIGKAFRRLAFQHHPDITGGSDAMFRQIKDAYEALMAGHERDFIDKPLYVRTQSSQHKADWPTDAPYNKSIDLEACVLDAMFKAMGKATLDMPFSSPLSPDKVREITLKFIPVLQEEILELDRLLDWRTSAMQSGITLKELPGKLKEIENLPGPLQGGPPPIAHIMSQIYGDVDSPLKQKGEALAAKLAQTGSTLSLMGNNPVPTLAYTAAYSVPLYILAAHQEVHNARSIRVTSGASAPEANPQSPMVDKLRRLLDGEKTGSTVAGIIEQRSALANVPANRPAAGTRPDNETLEAQLTDSYPGLLRRDYSKPGLIADSTPLPDSLRSYFAEYSINDVVSTLADIISNYPANNVRTPPRREHDSGIVSTFRMRDMLSYISQALHCLTLPDTIRQISNSHDSVDRIGDLVGRNGLFDMASLLKSPDFQQQQGALFQRLQASGILDDKGYGPALLVDTISNPYKLAAICEAMGEELEKRLNAPMTETEKAAFMSGLSGDHNPAEAYAAASNAAEKATNIRLSRIDGFFHDMASPARNRLASEKPRSTEVGKTEYRRL